MRVRVVVVVRIARVVCVMGMMRYDRVVVVVVT